MKPTIFCELDSADAAIVAARVLRDAGFDRMEAYTPCAVPELEQIIARPNGIHIPRAAFFAGILGASAAFGIIWYCNAYAYPLNVGGRPLDSLPADIPIMFETAVLFAALTTFVLVVLQCGLPRLAHPLFTIEGFDRVSDDRYWIGIEPSKENGALIESTLARVNAIAIHRVGETS
jgi:hypothetical protein